MTLLFAGDGEIVLHAFPRLLGFVFAPVMYLIGIPWNEAGVAGGLLVQHLPEGEEGRERLHVRLDHPEWEHVAILGGSVRHDELLDPALSLEATGFAERGQGVRLGLENQIGIKGKIPVCTRGGLKARGHPVGATGMYQIVEVAQQLRGECGATQVDGATVGMAQNIGGSGATILTHILRRE